MTEKDPIELLREWVRGTRADGLGPLGTNLKELEGIADMVEAELEAEREESAFWEAEYDAELNKRINAEHRTADMERTHMKLPVDADGVPIRPEDEVVHIGDPPRHSRVVVAVSEENFYCSNNVLHPSRMFRHVKPDTVESLLQELADEVWNASCESQTTWSDSGLDGIAELYAERIRKAVENGNG